MHTTCKYNFHQSAILKFTKAIQKVLPSVECPHIHLARNDQRVHVGYIKRSANIPSASIIRHIGPIASSLSRTTRSKTRCKGPNFHCMASQNNSYCISALKYWRASGRWRRICCKRSPRTFSAARFVVAEEICYESVSLQRGMRMRKPFRRCGQQHTLAAAASADNPE